MTPSRKLRLIDISRPLAATTASWPGDLPSSLSTSCRIREGASVNLGSLQASLHAATHCDAPYHVSVSGATIEDLPLEKFWGPAWVVDVSSTPANWKGPLDELDFTTTPRILFRTGGWPHSSRFPDEIPVMEGDLPAWLGQRGVSLVGVDLPSVDLLNSKTLDNHHALIAQGIVIVEGLWLEDVPAARYELSALPILVPMADGAPVRAVLRG